MKDFILKFDLIVIISLITSFIPIWNQLEKILKANCENDRKQAEIQISIEFIQQRLDRLDKWIDENSAFKQ